MNRGCAESAVTSEYRSSGLPITAGREVTVERNIQTSPASLLPYSCVQAFWERGGKSTFFRNAETNLRLAGLADKLLVRQPQDDILQTYLG